MRRPMLSRIQFALATTVVVAASMSYALAATETATGAAPSETSTVETEQASPTKDQGEGILLDAADAQDAAVTQGIVDLFEARDAGSIDVRFIAKSDHEGRIFITNKTPGEVQVKLPDAFVGVPVLAQFGGGGQGGGGFGGGGQGGGGNQAVGGGGGGGGFGGGGQGGGGGGVFSVPPEKITKVSVPLLCIEHGKPDPSSSNAYEIQPVDTYVDRPAVVELLKAFGRGELQHNAAQAAVWHLNNDLTWDQLAAKLTGTRRHLSRSPYFNRFELQEAFAYAHEANRRGTQAVQEETRSSGYDE